MNSELILFLLQDALTNGAIYGLLAIAIVLVFSVTRVLFIPQGEFVVFGAFTMASIQSGQVPGLLWLVIVMGALEVIADLVAAGRRKKRVSMKLLGLKALWPIAVAGLLFALPLADLPISVQALLTIAVILPMGSQLYRLFYQPLAAASPLILLTVSIAVHVALVSLSLLIFGPNGAQTKPFTDSATSILGMAVGGQTVWVLAVSILLVLAMYGFFELTLFGKALRATALNRTGARLVGISPQFSSSLAFSVAGLIGASSGILIAPITTLYYDSGLLIALKGFVGAVIGAMTGYPLAAAGALIVGLLESFSAFWASTYKEVIVFTLLIPVLLWRSRHALREEDHS
ncbi:MAG: branched-chain amino acid ABC transporter permease [Burkholderiales bacterium]|nr:branched-chain amino acid ABC transporter permease [Burkholderiales bacterium]ODU66231.1 MAG: ABC transporter permease [Lautropia sp. SCN 66-9]